MLTALGAIGTAIGAVSGGISIWQALRPEPKNPTILDYIMMYAPQVLELIAIACVILMYVSIFKKYKLKKIFLLYPLLITLTYFIFILLSDILAGLVLGLPILQYGLEILFSVFYIRDAIEVYTGKHQFVNLKPMTILSEFFK